MANYYARFDGDSGLNCYIRVFNMLGQVFDFADNTFKAIASATTPYVTMTYDSVAELYRATINLSLINSTTTEMTVDLRVYNNASPVQADKSISSIETLVIVSGQLQSSAVSGTVWDSPEGKIVAASAGGRIQRRIESSNSFENDLYHPLTGELVSTVTVDRNGNRSAVSTEE